MEFIIIIYKCHQKNLIRSTSTSSSLVTSTLENPPQLVTWSTNAAVSTKEPFKNMRKKLPISERLHSSMLGLWTSLRAKEKEVSLLTSLSGSSNHPNITSPLLMPLDTEISSRTWSLVLLKLIAPSSWLPHPKVNSRLVSQKKDKLDNTLFLLSLSVSSKWSFAATRWTKRLSTSLKKDTTKSRRKFLNSWKKLDTSPMLSHSSQFQDGTVTTC